MTMDTQLLNLAVERLMADGTTFDPADAVLLRTELPVQRKFSWSFKIHTPEAKAIGGKSDPLTLMRYSVLHTIDPIFSVSRIDILPIEERFETKQSAVCIHFNGQDQPTVMRRYVRRLKDIEFFGFRNKFEHPGWEDWKTPVEENAA